MSRRHERLRSTLAAILWMVAIAGCGERTPTGGVVIGEVAMAKGGGGSSGPTPIVNATDPSSAPQDVRLNVRVLGANYDNGSTVRFLLNGKGTSSVVVNSTQFVSGAELVADVTISAAAIVDDYDVEVTTRGGKKGIGIEKFSVTGPTADIAAATAGAGDGLYGDGSGPYPGSFIAGSGPGSGNFNMWPECSAGRRVALRIPWALGTIPDCRGAAHVQFHIPGLPDANGTCAAPGCAIGGAPDGDNYGPSVFHFFVIKGPSTRGKPSADKQYNVVWTDAAYTVLRRTAGGAPCEWRVVATRADLYQRNVAVPLIATNGQVALDVVVARDDGVCHTS